MTGRLPDFVVIGAGKSGTTTLARWLDAQPEVVVSDPKEPNFFANEEHWARGVGWYSSLFDAAGPGQLAGEATTAYADPVNAPTVAERMASVVPDVRLVYVVRQPITRLRSQYKYRLTRGEETLPLAKAVRQPDNRHVGRSLYHRCVEPYLRCFDREQLLVVRFEDLVGGGPEAWQAVLGHLALPARPVPGTVHNVTADRARHASPVLRAWRRAGLTGRAPAALRPVVERFRSLKRIESEPPARMLAKGDAPIPDDVVEEIWADVERFEAALGLGRLWDR